MFIYVSCEFLSLAIKIVFLILFVSLQFADYEGAQNMPLQDAAPLDF
jgi:hypothetical protein